MATPPSKTNNNFYASSACDPAAMQYVSDMTNFALPKLPEIKAVHAYAFDALSKEVDLFQRTLTPDSELGISVFGADNIIHVRAIRQSGQMVVFEGVDNQGRVARLIQHYTQVNLQMIAVDKIEDQAKRIGF